MRMPRWGDIVDRAWASRGNATKRTVTGAQACARIAVTFRPQSNNTTLLPILITMGPIVPCRHFNGMIDPPHEVNLAFSCSLQKECVVLLPDS